MPNTIHGLPAVSGTSSKILILGSMPSEESLRQQQYYANPRNGFWSIVMTLLGQQPDLKYSERIEVLIRNKISIWDTLKSCTREGSLDSSIASQTIQANDFLQFYQNHSKIRYVFFNGRKSQQVYEKKVLPDLGEQYADINYQSLPSSSPAMASLSREQKIDQWKIVRESLSK